MSPQQFSQGREEGKAATVPGKAADIGLTKEQMQEALMYMIQVTVSSIIGVGGCVHSC